MDVSIPEILGGLEGEAIYIGEEGVERNSVLISPLCVQDEVPYTVVNFAICTCKDFVFA